MDFRLPRPPFVPPRPPPPGVRPMPPFANPMNMAPQGRPLLNRPPRSFPRAGGPLPPPMFRGPPPPSAPPPPPPPILPPFAHQRPPPLIRPARFHQPFGFNRPAVPPFPPMFGDKFLLNGTKPRDFKHKMEAEFNKPWISPDMKDEILKKHKLHQKARKSKNPEVWDEFREQRNKVTSMLREAKLSFQGNSLQSKEKKFFCDTCDRAYENQEQLDEHLGQHVKCGREGCQFEAHTKIVDLHVKMQHESGYAPKIMQLKTPEEINQWREERKKNFPTLESIKQKQKENSDHKANGETINKNQPRINTKRKKNNRGRGFKYRMNRSMIPPGMPNRGPFPGRGLGPPFRGKMMAGRGRGRFGMNMPFLHLRSNPSINNGLRRFAGTANINNNQEMMDSSDNLPMKVALPIVANNKISFDENAPRIVPNLNADRMSYMFAADVDGGNFI